MSNDNYSRSEIEFIDGLLSYSESGSVEALNLHIDEIKNLNWFDEQDYLQLRLKGVIEVEKIPIQESNFEGSIETVNIKEKEFLVINERQLIRFWIYTLFTLAGKNLNQEIIVDKKGDYFYSDIETDSDSKIKVNFIVNKNISVTNGYFLSFISDVKQEIYENLIFWDEPIANESSALSFIQKLKEEGKLLSNKNFNYINIPAHLEPMELEGFKSIIKVYFERLGYNVINNSKYFRPESIDYSLPEEMIREVYILEEQKIFIVENGKRIEIHSFENGFKQSNEWISFHISKMKELIDLKVNVYNKYLQRKKMNFIQDFKVILVFITSIVLSGITSFKILFTNDLDSILKSKWFLYTHVGLSLLTIGLLIFLSLYPQIRLYFFSWSSNVNKKVKKYKIEYEKIKSPI